MCPDYDLLSAFIDGEVEAPWKEGIERHLETCANCREKIMLFRRITNVLEEDKEPDYRPSMARIKTVIESTPQNTKKVRIPIWKRQILVPVPMAAIAATLLICIGTIFTVTVANLQPAQKSNKGATIAEQPVVQDDELATIIKLMENSNFNNEVIFQLPEGSRFSMSGEPKFIRAKDLNRSK